MAAEEHNQYSEHDNDIPTFEEDIQMYADWTWPKSKHLRKVDKDKGFAEPINQDLPTSFLGNISEKLVLEHLSLCAELTEFSRETGIDLSGAQRHGAMQISNIVNTSKGREGNLLKVIRTAYHVNEERKANVEKEENMEEKKREIEPNLRGYFATR